MIYDQKKIMDIKQNIEGKSMITIFNRKEVLITYDMQKQADVRKILRNHKIAYDVKVKNLLSPSPAHAGVRGYTGPLGIDVTKSYEYKIYVKKADYERAVKLIR